MRIIIKYQVDNSEWNDDEFDANTDRELSISEQGLTEILKQRNLIGPDEFIHQIISAETKRR